MLLGAGVQIPDSIAIKSFEHYVSSSEANIIEQALAVSSNSFDPELQVKLVEIFSGYGCKQIPTPATLCAAVSQIARCELISKPLSVTTAVNAGVPLMHQSFWKEKSVEELYSLYTTCRFT